MVFLMASIPGIADFVDTGPFSRSVFSVEYGLVDSRVAKALRCSVCLAVLFSARAGRSSLEDCIVQKRLQVRFNLSGRHDVRLDLTEP